MQLVSRKNFMIFLATILVFAMGLMALTISKRPPKVSQEDLEIKQIKTQSTSDNIESIEKDINDTDFSGIEDDLNDIEAEMNQEY